MTDKKMRVHTNTHPHTHSSRYNIKGRPSRRWQDDITRKVRGWGEGGGGKEQPGTGKQQTKAIGRH